MKQRMSTALNNFEGMWTWTSLNLCYFSEPLFLLSTTYSYALHTLSQETLSNTLCHQFKQGRLHHDRCDVCRSHIWEIEDGLTCTSESLHPPLISSFFSSLLSLSSPLPSFFLLPPFFLIPLPPSPSFFFCFPSSYLPSPYSLTGCQVSVHTGEGKGCEYLLDKTCSEVSERCTGRKERVP